jgi:hypothetical protein
MFVSRSAGLGGQRALHGRECGRSGCGAVVPVARWRLRGAGAPGSYAVLGAR